MTRTEQPDWHAISGARTIAFWWNLTLLIFYLSSYGTWTNPPPIRRSSRLILYAVKRANMRPCCSPALGEMNCSQDNENTMPIPGLRLIHRHPPELGG